MEKGQPAVGPAASLVFGRTERGLPEASAPVPPFLCSLCILRGSHGQFVSPSRPSGPSSSPNTLQILACSAQTSSVVPQCLEVKPSQAISPASHLVPLPHSVPPRWSGAPACLPSSDGARPSGHRPVSPLPSEGSQVILESSKGCLVLQTLKKSPNSWLSPVVSQINLLHSPSQWWMMELCTCDTAIPPGD